MSANFFDLESEKTALAYALATADNFSETQGELRKDHLEDPRHQKIWEAAKFYYQHYGGLLDRNGFDALLRQNEVPQDKQTIYLTLFDDIKGKIITKDQYRVSIDVLDDLRFKRGLYDLVSSATGYLQRGTIDKQEVCNSMVASLLSIQQGKDMTVREMSYKEDVAQRVAEYQDRKAHPEKYMGVLYGFKKLDDLTGGMRPGELTIIFGRNASGKSTMAYNIAYNVAKRGKNVLLFTIEMPKEQLGRRMDSRHLQISARGLRNAALSAPEEKSFIELGKHGVNLAGDVQIVDMPQGCSYTQILPIIRRYKAKKPIDLIVIDYLNLMVPSRWSNSQVERTNMISLELKQLARLEHIPVLTPTRANRESTKVNAEDVGSEHVGWSDAIGYDADTMLYLEKGQTINSLEATTNLYVIKFRDGAQEKITLGTDLDRSFIGDLDDVLSSFRQQLGVPSV